MTIDTSLSPYFNDYDEGKLFTSILFTPSKAVQVRELNQLQTILQEQVTRFGNHIFEDGSVVIPGEVNYDLDFKYAKITLDGAYGTYKDLLDGPTVFVVGENDSLFGKIQLVKPAEDSDPLTIYVKYQDSGFTGLSKEFDVAENISFFNQTTNSGSVIKLTSPSGLFEEGETVTGGTSGATGTVVTFYRNTLYVDVTAGTFEAAETITGGTSGSTGTSDSVDTENLPGKIVGATVDEVGTGAGATVTPGIYFVNGVFVLVKEQLIILSKYTNTPSYRVGFSIVEEVITYIDDASLLDNASGALGFTSPGADRLRTTLTLSKRDIGTDDDQDFIEILRLENGQLRTRARGPNYSLLEDVLATRTYDESGNYVVDNFDIAIREHLLANDNGGVYLAGDGGDADKLVATLDKGKAYVSGYGVETISTTFVDIDKAQDFALLNNSVTNINLGNYIKVTNMNVVPDYDDFGEVTLYSGAVGTDGDVPAGSVVGVARVRYVRYDSGTIDDQTLAKFRLYLFDIRDSSGGNLDSSIVVSALSVYDPVSEFTADITDSSAMFDTNNNTLVYKLPLDTVKTLKPGGTSDTTYQITKVFESTVSSNQILLNAAADEVFAGKSNVNYILSIVHDDLSRDPTQDVIIDTSKVNFTFGGVPTGKSLTITSGATDLSTWEGQSVRLVATMIKTASERVKTDTNTTLQGSLTSRRLSLAKADVYKINSIIDDTTGQDVTNQYTLENGKRENYYDISKVSLNPGFPLPVSTITIDFNYFAHGVGDFFSVDSYSGIAYKDIPYENIGGEEYCMSDLIDFRPRINNAGDDFVGLGSAHGYMPKPLEYFRSDIEYYLNRIDKVFVDANGNFDVLKGNPALAPSEPKNIENAIFLYTLFIPAFTKSTEDIDIESIDNRRYTMRDIGTLENRIKNLEYYTTLSLLETQTSDLKILDESGNDRFKNGFAVDPFKDHTIGDPDRPDYVCSIDTHEGVLRPEFGMEGVDLEFVAGSSSDYALTSDYITLPYIEQELVKQPFATRTMNVNPYAVFSWAGVVQMFPARDTWIDTRYSEAVILNQTIKRSESKTIEKARNVSGRNWTLPFATRNVLTGRWNSWKDNWLGNGRWGARQARDVVSNVLSEAGLSSGENTTRLNRVGNRLTTTIRNISDNVSTSTNISNKVVGEKTIDVSIIPFMRSREVDFTAEGMKPLTVVYPFFDDVDVSSHCKPVGGSYGGTLKTDDAGKVVGVFKIPNTQSLRFRVGSKLFKLIDNADNSDVLATTYSEGNYTARGTLKTQQKTILSTKEIVTTNTRSITTVKSTSTVRWRDPLAESFLIEEEEGVFITSIDIYVASKDANIPITMEIREMDNGYPSQTVVPGSVKTLNPSDVNISSNGSDNLTTFTFDRPIYLQGNQEYCFVLLANSTKYNVWIATMGEKIVGTNSYVSKQPFVGVMFKSQNSSTWSASQNDDIKFSIKRAKFDTSKQPSIVLRNKEDAAYITNTNGLLATDGSTTLQVYCQDHGYIVGSKAPISGAVTGLGVPAGDINKTHDVSGIVSLDVFEIVVDTSATGDGFFGGANIAIERNYPYSVINTNIPEMVFNGTAINWDISTKTYKSTDGSETAYLDGFTNAPITNGEDVIFDSLMFIGNADEETSNMSGDNSLLVNATLSSSKDNVSPVIDIESMSAIAVNNRINSPTIVETDPIGGECFARYITKTISLAIEAVSLRVYVDVNRPQGSGIEVFYRIGSNESEMIEKDWISLPTIVENPESDNGIHYENEYGVDDVSEFKYYQVKIVMYSNNDATVPTCRNLRAIALGT